jgi:PAS domain S-box-containing protein
MVQLDKDGRIARVNEALLQETGMKAESLLGRTLTGLSMDPDPRIAKQLMHMLLEASTFMATPRPRIVN